MRFRFLLLLLPLFVLGACSDITAPALPDIMFPRWDPDDVSIRYEPNMDLVYGHSMSFTAPVGAPPVIHLEQSSEDVVVRNAHLWTEFKTPADCEADCKRIIWHYHVDFSATRETGGTLITAVLTKSPHVRSGFRVRISQKG